MSGTGRVRRSARWWFAVSIAFVLGLAIAAGPSPVAAQTNGGNRTGSQGGPSMGRGNGGSAAGAVDLTAGTIGREIPGPVVQVPLDDETPVRRVRRAPVGRLPTIFLPPAGETRFVEGEVLVRAASGVAIETIARRHRLTVVASRRFDLAQAMIHRLRGAPGVTTRAILARLADERGLVSAQANHQFALQQDATSAAPASASAETATAPLPGQWAAETLGLAAVHRTVRGAGVTIGLVDGGVDAGHAELAGAVGDSFDALGAKEPRPSPHGTAMAGAIAAHARLVGVAPAARLVVARAFGEAGSSSGSQGTSWHVLAGLDFVVGRGARVLSMSFAGPRDPLVGRAVATARERGVIAIAAAGNAGPASPPLYPAAEPGVIAVTAADAGSRVFASANRGAHLAVAAPGVDVLVAAPQGGYDLTTGTSVAAAEVAGVAALMLERQPRLGEAEAGRILRRTARDLGAPGPDPEFGAGLVDVAAAVAAAGGR